MEANQVKFEKTAHYYTIGEAGKHIKRLVIACHGYGQLASRIIYKFEAVDDGETFIVAPEGLSRFYFDQKGTVGATWMTKHDRLTEIEDYCNWLDWIYQHFVPQMSDDVEIILFGFSQGSQTVARWFHARQPNCHQIIFWAGDIPSDISYEHLQDYLADKKIQFVYGHQDRFITPEAAEKLKKFMTTQGFVYTVTTFEGKHVVNRSVLKSIL